MEPEPEDFKLNLRGNGNDDNNNDMEALQLVLKRLDRDATTRACAEVLDDQLQLFLASLAHAQQALTILHQMVQLGDELRDKNSNSKPTTSARAVLTPRQWESMALAQKTAAQRFNALQQLVTLERPATQAQHTTKRDWSEADKRSTRTKSSLRDLVQPTCGLLWSCFPDRTRSNTAASWRRTGSDTASTRLGVCASQRSTRIKRCGNRRPSSRHNANAASLEITGIEPRPQQPRVEFGGNRRDSLTLPDQQQVTRQVDIKAPTTEGNQSTVRMLVRQDTVSKRNAKVHPTDETTESQNTATKLSQHHPLRASMVQQPDGKPSIIQSDKSAPTASGLPSLAQYHPPAARFQQVVKPKGPESTRSTVALDYTSGLNPLAPHFTPVTSTTLMST